MSGNGHDYESRHGSQEAQAAAQATAGTATVDGPWRLVRLDDSSHVTLPNSVRSTMREAARLQEEEHARTGIEWDIEHFRRDP